MQRFKDSWHRNSGLMYFSIISVILGIFLIAFLTFEITQRTNLTESKIGKVIKAHADMMMGPQHIGCTFLSDPNATPAFCDTFQTPAPLPRGRSGDLNPLNWDFSRVTGQAKGTALPITAQYCRMKVAGLYPPNDSFFCGPQFNEASHWMETFNDGGGFAYNDAMIRQPFDFTNRTGIITYEVDAKTDGGHMYWPDVWITDQPIPAPQTNQFKSLPKEGVDLVFSDNCNGAPGTDATKAALQNVVLIKNYQIAANLVSYSVNGSPQFYKLDCYTVAPDQANHFEIRISQSEIQVWATDADQTNFREVADVPNVNLNFSIGYVHFEHSDYNPEKFGITGQETYHWHNLGFDGPRLPIQRGYSVPNATVGGTIDYMLVNTNFYDKTVAGNMQVCCELSPQYKEPPFIIPNVDLSNAIGAFISLDAYYEDAGSAINYRVNGGPWHSFAFPYPNGIIQWGGANGIAMPLPISDLKSGTNTLELSETSSSKNADGSLYNISLEIGNIDLVVQTSTIPPVPPATYMYQPKASVAPFPPTSFKVVSSVAPLSIDEGQSTTISATVTNITSSPITAQFNMSILGPTNIQVFAKSFNNSQGITFQPNVPQTFTATYTAPVEDPKFEYAFAYSSGTFSVIESLLSPDQTQIYYTNSYDDQTLPLKTAESDTAFSIPAGSTPLPLLASQPSASPTSTISVTPIQGDFDGDGAVNLTDLSVFAKSYGTSSPNIPNPACDLNGDGKVDLIDLSIFAKNWGK